MKSKKKVFLIISIAYLILSLFLHLKIDFAISQTPILPILLIVGFLALIWFLLIKLFEYKNIINKIVFFELYILGNIMFLFWFPTLGDVSRVVYITITAIFTYILLLALNVYFVSERQEEQIPLLQPAKLFVFITVIIDVFVWSTAFYKITYSNIIKNTENQLLILGGISLLFLVYYYVLGKTLKWFLSGGKVGELTEEMVNKRNSSILVATFVLWQVSVALMFSPTEIFGRSLILSVTAYVVLNILSKYLSHKIDKTVYLKSFIMIFIAYVLVYLL